jgi:hypothetical protein
VTYLLANSMEQILSREPDKNPILTQIIPARVCRSTAWRCNLILSSHRGLGLPSGLLPLSLRTKTMYSPFLLPHVPYGLPISFFLIYSSLSVRDKFGPSPFRTTRNLFKLLRRGAVRPSPTVKLEDHPLSPVYDFFDILSAIHIWSPSPPSAVWWRVMSWQGKWIFECY